MAITLDSARETLREREAELTSMRVHVSDLRVEPGRFLAGNEAIRITDEGLARFCRQVSAPASYVTRMDPALQARILQFHIDQGDLERDDVELITRNQELVSIERDALHRLKSSDVLDAVADGVGSVELKVHELRLSEESFQLNLVSDAAHTEVAPGDIIQAGIQVGHSLIGETATLVQAYLLRLVCSNGMTHRECVSRGSTRTRRLPSRRPDAHSLQMAQIRRLAAETSKSLQAKLETLRSLQQEEVEVDHLMRRWIERARLSTRELLPLLRTAWIQEGGRPTAYDAMNALTRVATHHANLDWRVRRALASLAGILAFRQIHFCPRCFSLLNSSSNSPLAT